MKTSTIKHLYSIVTVMMAFFLNNSVFADDIYQNPDSERRIWPFNDPIPACDDPYVLRKIIHDFETREREYWNSGMYISSFKNVIETGQRINGLDYTPRRYCKSDGVFSDGRERRVYYNITPDQSVVLSGQIMDWCIEGLDRTKVDGPECRRVRQ